MLPSIFLCAFFAICISGEVTVGNVYPFLKCVIVFSHTLKILSFASSLFQIKTF